jgi:hypothetical protein
MKELDPVGYDRFMMLSKAIENAKQANLLVNKSSISLASALRNQTRTREFSDSSEEENLVNDRPVAIPDSRPSHFRTNSSSEEEIKEE